MHPAQRKPTLLEQDHTQGHHHNLTGTPIVAGERSYRRRFSRSPFVVRVKKEIIMTTHFVTLIQTAERGEVFTRHHPADQQFVPRPTLRKLTSRWLRSFRSRPVGSDEQHLAA